MDRQATIKALTLTQPWATLMASGTKAIEPRGWATTYRGSVAVHAGKGTADFSRAELDGLCRREPFRTALGGVKWGDLPHGRIVAVARLVDCARIIGGATAPRIRRRNIAGYTVEYVREGELPFGNFAPGRYAWVFEDVVALRYPVPCVGARQLWDLPVDVEAEVRRQMGEVMA